jgi:hypothetical protein
MLPTKIENDELLYRALRANSDEFSDAGGALRISSSAFNDRDYKPSVDRSTIRVNPEDAKKSSTDRIVQVLTSDVRAVAGIKITGDKNETRTHVVDAIHRPILDEPMNIAHSQIECDPAFANKSRFLKLKEALARLALKSGLIA